MKTLNSHLVSSNAFDSGATLAVPVPRVPLYIATNTVSASFNCPAVDVSNYNDVSYTAVVAGGIAGTLTMQGCNDPGGNYLISSGTNLVNWVTVQSSPSSSFAIVSGSNTVGFNFFECGFKWTRLALTLASGTGSVDVFISAKGAH